MNEEVAEKKMTAMWARETRKRYTGGPGGAIYSVKIYSGVKMEALS
jgi:hypothetical protein